MSMMDDDNTTGTEVDAQDSTKSINSQDFEEAHSTKDLENNPQKDPKTNGEDASKEVSSDDDLAAAWENSLTENGGGIVFDEGDSDKLLSQNEIDSLLGISSDAALTPRTGIQHILSEGSIYYERLPMLEVVFDRLVRLLSTTLRNFTGENVEVSIEGITSVRFGDFLNSIPLPAMINIFMAREWEEFALMTVDSPLIYSIVDVLLGGRRGNALMRIEGRPYTTIERQLIQRMVEVILGDLKLSFNPLCDISFDFDRLETNPSFAAIARPGNAAIVTTIRIDMEGRGGHIQLLIPYATIEPIRDLLLQTFMGEKFGQDSMWEKHLAGQLWSTSFELNAVLGESVISLGELLSLKKGSQIILSAQKDSPTQLRCGEHHLFSGSLGRRGSQIALKIEEDYLIREEAP